jgi:protein gp37
VEGQGHGASELTPRLAYDVPIVSANTTIEWATKSWNPTTGCTRVSAGCDNCYAFRLHDMRFAKNRAAARANDHRSARDARSAGVSLPFATQYDTPFSKIQLLDQRLGDPFTWRQSERVFVDSMADLFHEAVPDAFLDRVFLVMEQVDRHVYQVLTKRPARLAAYARRRYGDGLAPAHVWLGTSIEDINVASRVDELRQVPARVRFLSCEPLIGSLRTISLVGIHWVIAGGESGPRRRRLDMAWVRELRDLCGREEVAFFFKQVGGHTPKAGGRALDGRTHDDFPVVENAALPALAPI